MTSTIVGTRVQIIAALAVLGIAVAGGFAATNLFQRTVAIVPGIEGCSRLEGSARQIDCLSEEFRAGARESADSKSGDDRDQAVITYVRRAERLAADDARLAGLCHPAMHQLGRDEGARAADADRVPAFPGGSSQLCTAGYVHGLSEGYLAGTPDADVAAVYPKLCHDASAEEGCAHGIGHALLQAQGTGDPEETSSVALARCGALPGAVRSDCHDGIYMELAMRIKPRPVPIKDFVEVCSSTPDVERELSCWGYMGLSIMSNDVPTSEVPGWCAKASLPGQYTCIEGYGRDIGAAKAPDCVSAAKDVGLQRRCIDGAIGLQVGSGHVSGDEARAACKRISSTALASYCTTAVGRYLTGKARVEHSDTT